MKRLVISLSLLFFATSFTYGQIVDFTGIDLQTESVTVIDETTRPTGWVFGAGIGFQGTSFPEIGYIPQTKFDLMFLAYQCTPQFLWNIFDYRVEVGGNATLLDYGTQFLYYFSPKYAGSSYVSGRIGYASTLGDCEIDDDYWNYCSVDGLTVGFSYGYAWKHLRVEAFVDMINSQVKHHDWRNGDESRQHLGTNFGFKAIYYGILSGNARSSLWSIL